MVASFGLCLEHTLAPLAALLLVLLDVWLTHCRYQRLVDGLNAATDARRHARVERRRLAPRGRLRVAKKSVSS